ncbi:MAG: hypothetical protein QM655_12590 [Nocardioidaceae bacterium]
MRARQLASFGLATGIPPSEAKALTRLERQAYLDELDEIKERKRR